MNEQDIKKDIEKRIKKLIDAGKTKEVKQFKDFHEQEDLRDAFFNKLFILGYTQDKNKRNKIIKQAKNIADKLPDIKGWPKDKKKFWNTESFGWESRIPKEIRDEIKKELSFLKGKNLSLGSGSHPYVKDSVLVDISEEMLKNTKNEKHILDLDKQPLPFKNNSFDSVTMVFIVDYLKNLKSVLKEVKRVLKKNGTLVIVNSKKPIDDFYRTQEVKHITDFKRLLKDFNIKTKELTVQKNTITLVKASPV